MIQINENDLIHLKKTLSKLETVAKKELIRELAFDFHQDVEVRIEKHSKSGNLLKSLYIHSIPNGWEVGLDDGFSLATTKWKGKTVNYGVFVHWGTKPHKIVPKEKSTLRFNSNGMFRFSKEVAHKGYVGDPFFEDARDKIFAFKNMDDTYSKLFMNKQ